MDKNMVGSIKPGTEKIGLIRAFSGFFGLIRAHFGRVLTQHEAPRARPHGEQDLQGDPFVEVTMLDGDGNHDSAYEHHVALLQVFPAYGIRGHNAFHRNIEREPEVVLIEKRG